MFSAKYAVKTVSRRKKRNMLTILGLAIGVAMIASAQIATDTLTTTFTDLVLSEIGEVDVVVDTKDNSLFDQSIYDLLANDPTIQQEISQNGITPRLSLAGLATDPQKGQIETNIVIWGINDTLDTPFGKLIDTETGKELFVKDLAFGEIIIGRPLAESLQTEKGKTIIIGFTNKTDQSINFPVTIAHIAKNTGKATWNGGDTIFLSLPHIRQLYGAEENEINVIHIATKAGEKTSDKTIEAIETTLDQEGLLDLFQVIALRDTLKENMEEGLGNFESMLIIFGSFVIVSGIILIINIFLMNVEERKRTTGVLRAVGMKRSQVINSFLTEAIILGIIGAFIGILFGLLIGYLMGWYVTNTIADAFEIEDFTVKLILAPSVIITSVIAGIILAIIASVYPAIRASKVDIVETLKGIEKPKRKKAGKRSLILGITLLSFGIYTLSRGNLISLLIGSTVIILGTGITARSFISKEKAWDLTGAGLITVGTLLLITQTEYEAESELFILLAIFTIIAGGIILIGINLETITDALNRFLMRFQKARGVSLLSTKYVGRQKTRSTLTFAIFAIILSMNVGMAIFATSTGDGFDRYAEKYAGGLDILAITQVPMPQNTNKSIQNLDPSIEHVEAFPGTQYGSFYLDENLSFDEMQQAPIYAIDRDLEQNFDFKWSQEDENAYKEASEKYGIEITNPWQLLAINATDQKGRPYVIANTRLGIEGIIAEVGDSIWLRMQDGKGQEFIIVADPIDPPYGLAIFTSAQIPLQAYTEQIKNNQQTIFFIKTTETINSPKNEEIAQKIETYGNKPEENPENTVYGIEATTTYEIYEESYNLMQKMFNLLNAFIFTGFFVGVIGLLVVAIRSVSERKREIGMMRSIGFRQKTVVRVILLEILIVALLGLTFAIINGILVAYSIFKTFLEDFDFIIPWTQLALFITITLAFALIAAWYPGKKAAQIQPSEALRYVG